jgi:hypothetical protein
VFSRLLPTIEITDPGLPESGTMALIIGTWDKRLLENVKEIIKDTSTNLFINIPLNGRCESHIKFFM